MHFFWGSEEFRVLNRVGWPKPIPVAKARSIDSLATMAASHATEALPLTSAIDFSLLGEELAADVENSINNVWVFYPVLVKEYARDRPDGGSEGKEGKVS